MKKILFIALTVLTMNVYGQDKNNFVHFNKLTEVSGTEYVIASIENWSKISETTSSYLLFINTKTSERNQVDFPKNAGILKLEQIKLDSLEINLVVVSARTVDLDGKSGIDWNDPTQIIIISPNGKEKTQLTEDKFFVRTWTVNRLTGTIVVTGHYDTNDNKKFDKNDKNEIHIYDLKTLKMISKM
ncbi:hypothetical protein [Pedobacter sp. UBA4863]|uniref:hypothetical protein n=1 Tax=Pedobacter sp. UBA4863 TaxID=1947060 RepID=UPI0025FCFED0|nr:hypothetical protein [Pedobacter sp. UBA4863]